MNYFVNDSFIFDSELFPEKCSNMFQCPLIMATHHVPPYIFVTEQPDRSLKTDGIEGLMILEIEKHLNFSLRTDFVPYEHRFNCLNCDICICDSDATSVQALNKVYINWNFGCLQPLFSKSFFEQNFALKIHKLICSIVKFIHHFVFFVLFWLCRRWRRLRWRKQISLWE